MALTIGEKFILSCIEKNSVTDYFFARESLFIEKADAYLRKVVNEYYKDSSKLPSVMEINDATSKSYRRLAIGEPKFYHEQLKTRFIQHILTQGLPSVYPFVDTNPRVAKEMLEKMLANIVVDGKSTDIKYSDNALERFKRYELRKTSGGINYISTGDPYLDSIFHGWEATDLVTIGGKSGTKKSFWMLIMTIYLDAWLDGIRTETIDFTTELDLDRPILLISNEMDDTQISDRLDCMNFKLPYNDYLNGMLSKADEARFKKGLTRLEDIGSNIVVLYNVKTLEDLKAKIIIYNPIATFLDGSYLLHPEISEGYEKTVKITRGLKEIALSSKSPIINSTQLRKNAGKVNKGSILDGQDEFYHGSYIQDSDFALRFYEEKDFVLKSLVGIDVVKGRRIPPNTKIMWKANTYTMDFEFQEPEIEEEIEDEFI